MIPHRIEFRVIWGIMIPDRVEFIFGGVKIPHVVELMVVSGMGIPDRIEFIFDNDIAISYR